MCAARVREPPFGQHLPISDNYDEDECGDDDADLFSFLLSQILVGPGELLLRLLKDIRYVGPIRAVPPRNFMPQTSPDESRWSSGLAAKSTHVDTSYEFGIGLLYPSDYRLFCDDSKLPIDTLDRHILSEGQACLGVPTDIRRRWQEAPDIISFLDTIVAPFLAWQLHYDAFGSPPPWGERAHFGKGVVQYYAEILGLPDTANIIGFMRLMTRKNPPRGHEPCPCGSGQNLRNCHHRDVILHARTLVTPADAASDVARLASRVKPHTKHVVQP